MAEEKPRPNVNISPDPTKLDQMEVRGTEGLR